MTSSDKKKSAHAGRTILAMTALTCALPISAQAQVVLEEIIVSAQKRAENLQDVPIAVASISGEALQAAGVTDTGALASITPGVAIQQTGQSFQPYIRGVGTPAFGPGVENPVALYVDDVYYASQLQGIVNLVDVSQVNILKGPQGTLFGRNATGGVIQLTTRDPAAAFGGSFRTELDNYLTSRNNLYLTGGVTDAINANISLNYATQGEGWGKNIKTGNDINKIDREMSVLSKWVFQISDTTKLKLAVDYSDKSNNIGANYQTIPGSPHRIPGQPLASDPWDVNKTAEGLTRVKGGGASVRLDTDLGFANLVSISAYRQYRFSTLVDSSFGPTPLLDIGYRQLGRQISQELQLVSPKNDRFSWVGGLYYFHANETGRDVDVTLHGPLALVIPPFIFDNYVTRTNAVQTNESISGFGQGTLQLVPGTNLTLGLRYTSEKRHIDGHQDDSQGGGPFAPINLQTGLPIFFTPGPTVRNESFKNNKLTYRLAVDQQFTDDVMGYVSYNRGFKSGGFNGFRLGYEVLPYRLETIDAFELGLKTELLDHRMRFNSAAFFNKYKDIQVQKFVGPSAIIVNGAKADFYGIDMDMEFQATEGLKLTSGFEWLHAEFKDYPDADFFQADPTQGLIAISGSAEGKTVPYAPKWTASVGANYSTVMSLGKLTFNVSNAYNNGYYNDASNDQFLRQKRFNLLNAGVSLDVLEDTLTVGIWGRNLLNEAVYSLQFAGTGVGYGRDISNPPRTAGITVTYRFGAK